MEDAEFAKTAAIKARQSADADLNDYQSQLEEALRNKKDIEDKCARVVKEKAELQTQVSSYNALNASHYIVHIQISSHYC